MADQTPSESWDNKDRGTPNFAAIEKSANAFIAKSERLGDKTKMIWMPNSVHRTQEQARVQEEGKNTELTPAQEWQKFPQKLNELNLTYKSLQKRKDAGEANLAEVQDAKDKYDVTVAEVRGMAKTLLLSQTFSGKISKNSFENLEKSYNKHDISLLTVDGHKPNNQETSSTKN